MGNELQRLLDAFTRNLLAGEDDLADGIRGKKRMSPDDGRSGMKLKIRLIWRKAMTDFNTHK